ncbi:hypothetical protein QCA50_000292 [Cerrena zonata]|uniref:Uncharacterized protein n=1 Tax=Cerrena zonata TaxID=2478898 RepID=A0AAW0GZQ8_9APHY
MATASTSTYRSIVREIYKASIQPRSSRNPIISSNFRAIFESACKSKNPYAKNDLANAVTFMQSQRTHKELLDRYNPLHDLTVEERIKATARRVGLDMPVSASESKDE